MSQQHVQCTWLTWLVLAKPVHVYAREPQTPNGRHYGRETQSKQDTSVAGGQASQCPPGLAFVSDVSPDPSSRVNEPPSRIPKIIHQTGRSRCVSAKFHEVMRAWMDRFPGWAYRFHDDAAMESLLARRWHAFPLLHAVVQCVHSMTMKADMWRYLALWRYGGIYADMDVKPRTLSNASISLDSDALFFIDVSVRSLTQYFMAATAQSPLMESALKAAICHVLDSHFPGGVNRFMYIARTTGPGALKRGFVTFMESNVSMNITYGTSITPGLYIGQGGHRVRVAGDHNRMIVRDALGRAKKGEYTSMNMTHFSGFNQHNGLNATNRSCMSEERSCAA